MTTIDILINDILLNIFSFLPEKELNKARQVSKRWNDLLSPQEVQKFKQQLQEILLNFSKLNVPTRKHKGAEKKFQLDRLMASAVAKDIIHLHLFNKGQKPALLNELKGLSMLDKHNHNVKHDKAFFSLEDSLLEDQNEQRYKNLSEYLRSIKIESKNSSHKSSELDFQAEIDNEKYTNAVLQTLSLEERKYFTKLLLNFLQGEPTVSTGDKIIEMLEIHNEANYALKLDEKVKNKDCLNNPFKAALVSVSILIGVLGLLGGIIGLSLKRNQAYSIIALLVGIFYLSLGIGWLYLDKLRKKEQMQSNAKVSAFFKSVTGKDAVAIDIADENQPLDPASADRQRGYLSV